MTQHQMIIEYLKINGEIVPAKMAGVVFKDGMFGSETSKRCRELRDPNSPSNPFRKQILGSKKDGRFEVFYLLGQEKPNGCCFSYKQFGIHAMDCFKNIKETNKETIKQGLF